jgi:hypothetical protein
MLKAIQKKKNKTKKRIKTAVFCGFSFAIGMA